MIQCGTVRDDILSIIYAVTNNVCVDGQRWR